MCQNCWHKVKRKYHLKFFVSTRYSEIKQRCINPNNKRADIYNGLPYCSQEEFFTKFLQCPALKRLYKIWQRSGFRPRLCPSVDRIDPEKGYVISNIRFITHSENASRQRTCIPCEVFSIEGIKLSEHSSLGAAVKKYEVQQSNAWKVMNGQRRHTGGLIFKAKKAA